MVTGGWPSCEAHDDAAAPLVDRSATFGAEIVVTVIGSGRVTTRDGALDCPGTCFVRLLVDDAHVDGGVAATMVSAVPSRGSTFDGWKFDEVDLGIRARGPAQCSPMVRKTSLVDPQLRREESLVLRYGETTGTPPKGRETECADYAKVPVAYAITAMFRQSSQPTFDSGVVPPTDEVLFYPPPGGDGPAREIGVVGTDLYWRYESIADSTLSGIATGNSRAGRSSSVVQPFTQITGFDVDRHVAFQTFDGDVKVIEAGRSFSTRLGVLPFCLALATDSSNLYCRSFGGMTTTLWAWPISGLEPPSAVYTLPVGRDLAVDEPAQKLYFSYGPAAAPGQAIVESAPRMTTGDAGAPVITQLAANQSVPQSLVVGPAYLFWLDDHGGTPTILQATAVAKTGFGSPFPGIAGTTVRFIAADPSTTDYWVGIVSPGSSTILRAVPGSPTTTFTFRTGLTSLNGLAVDSDYVYWTQDDGRVYRGLKFGQGLGGP